MAFYDSNGDEKLMIIVSMVVIELKMECAQCLEYEVIQEKETNRIHNSISK